MSKRPPYNFFKFLLDVFGVVITCGLWIFGILIREWRYR